MNTAIEVREYTPEDAEAALALRNVVFPAISAEDWSQSQTAAVAYVDGRLVGVIPFTVRDFIIAPGVSMRAAFANSVAVAEDLRDRGIGSRMMVAARDFLPRGAEAMCVYTGNEATGPQYNFYRRTGHVDLLYPRLSQRPASPDAGPCDILTLETVDDLEEQLLAVYSACYADCAGSPPRERGYWHRALASHIFVEMPYDGFGLVAVPHASQIEAYAIVGAREGTLVVLESAARSNEVADRLWPAVDAAARQMGVGTLQIRGQDFTTPLYRSLRRAGFVAEPRDDVLSGRVLDPAGVYRKLWESRGSGPPVMVEVWTPERSLTLPGNDGEILAIEMKEEVLHRLLLARLDLEAAVREQHVTVREGTWSLVSRVAAALRPATWVYQQMDYI